ncbi:SDR family oxidoreductase [Nocardioides albidus]|uniref:SDR family oxidoreductase n=1 Tax=Nocardioides albidus TaxID=1517589 RepID=A0A5C4VSK2_9ACTN|nr:SDR family oxidoreductase [Nocardioides albidus]TNM38505.1 SDR family oxidoreductase [Nocardioides albidus]
MRVAVVTGAGSGLGRVIARGLADAGFSVALLGRTAASLAETASGLPDALVLPTDVADAAQVDAAFAAVVQRWGRVDVLVNNAGTFGPSGDVDEISVDDWSATVAVNLTGAFLCARAAFGLMKRQDPRGGRIINNGSISAHTPRPGSAAYTATKHAITGLTKALALDGRPHDIAVGQIDIGNAATEMTAGIAVGARQADGSIRPEPTFDPRHVADAVVAMARLPLGVSVPTMTLLATGMPYAGRG